MKTVDELHDLIDQITKLQEQAAEIATAMLRLEDKKHSVDSDEIYFENGTIMVDYDVHLGCGEWEMHDFVIPNSYFFDENFINDAREKLRLKREAEEEKSRQRAEKRRLEREAVEIRKYKELKEKYGDREL